MTEEQIQEQLNQKFSQESEQDEYSNQNDFTDVFGDDIISQLQNQQDTDQGQSQGNGITQQEPVIFRRVFSDQKSYADGRNKGNFVPTEKLPKMVIVGRPNVGKSQLFNMLCREQHAVVFEQPGVTRDRMYRRAFWGGTDFCVIDTGGLSTIDENSIRSIIKNNPDSKQQQQSKEKTIPESIESHVIVAIEEADVIVIVMDGQEGPTQADGDILQWLRRHYGQKPIVLAVNKCESPTKGELQASLFWEYGLQPYAVSAINGTGTGDLLDQVVQSMPPPIVLPDPEAQEKVIKLAIIGRPNAGKSSLINVLAGNQRQTVSSLPGTTVDAVDIEVTGPDGSKFQLVDTAGMRKKANLRGKRDKMEQQGVTMAIRAMRKAEVIVLVVDGVEGITQQDYRLTVLAKTFGKALVICVNKWDLLTRANPQEIDKYVQSIKGQVRDTDWANILFTSTKTGFNIKNVLKESTEAYSQWKRRPNTGLLNYVLQDIQSIKPAPYSGRKRGRIYYGTSPSTEPPTFVLFCNDSKLFNDVYKRYLEKSIRDNFGFKGTPVRILFRGKQKRDQTNAKVVRTNY